MEVPELELFRQSSIRYFAVTLDWIGSAHRLLDVVLRKNKFKAPLVNTLRRDVKYKIAEFNQKSDFVFDGIVFGKIPVDALEGEYSEKSNQLQVEIRRLKERLDSIVLL